MPTWQRWMGAGRKEQGDWKRSKNNRSNGTRAEAGRQGAGRQGAGRQETSGGGGVEPRTGSQSPTRYKRFILLVSWPKWTA